MKHYPKPAPRPVYEAPVVKPPTKTAKQLFGMKQAILSNLDGYEGPSNRRRPLSRPNEWIAAKRPTYQWPLTPVAKKK